MPSRRKRKVKGIKSLKKQDRKHAALIDEHKDDPRKQHTIGYWLKERLKLTIKIQGYFR